MTRVEGGNDYTPVRSTGQAIDLLPPQWLKAAAVLVAAGIEAEPGTDPRQVAEYVVDLLGMREAS